MIKRQPVKALNLSAQAILNGSAAEKARKVASKKALHEAIDPPKAKLVTKAPKIAAPKLPEAVALERANALAAQKVDFDAIHGDTDAPITFEQYLEQQGYAPDGAPLEVRAKAGTYFGPMLALRDAAKHYVKGANGNPHSNDWLAEALSALDQPSVIRVLIAAMKLEGNPYLGLNNGQQSMNLRNKARGMVKKGLLTQNDVTQAITVK